jgi:hypothetical protein
MIFLLAMLKGYKKLCFLKDLILLISDLVPDFNAQYQKTFVFKQMTDLFQD